MRNIKHSEILQDITLSRNKEFKEKGTNNAWYDLNLEGNEIFIMNTKDAWYEMNDDVIKKAIEVLEKKVYPGSGEWHNIE
ncbi:MAG: hypothetical protein AAB405_00875 [Patescibacteria group bacterium]